MELEIADDTGVEVQSQLDFPIIAIGASAGGLEAVTQMILNTDTGTGMAFVLIMHLDPNHESMMAELLSSKTRLRVRQISDNEHVEVDCLHIIPPGSSLRIEDGKFKLDPFSEPRGLRRPIDSFFASVAQVQGDKAACVVLSGTGADGTAGVRSIKEFGGVCAVQSPEEARYDGMPISAISTGLSDFVLEAEQIIPRLRAYFDGTLEGSPSFDEQVTENWIQEIFGLIREGVGADFAGYKRSTLLRRLQRRMQVLDIDTIEKYVERLAGSLEEQQALARDFLINVTSFFREHEHFEHARKTVLKPLLQNAVGTNEVRIWVPGCSSGQEAFTIAMMVAETCEELGVSPLVQIFATDVDEQMIEHARKASYPLSMYSEIPEQYREKYTIAAYEKFEILPDIRRLVRFSVHNIIQNPPFSKIDFISCRNLLIYFGQDLQSELFALLHLSLRPGGYLLLGTSESVSKGNNLFRPVDQKARLFKRNDAAKRVHVSLPLGNTSRNGMMQRGIGRLARETDFPRHQSFDASNLSIYEHYAPPFIRMTSDGQIIDSSGDLSLFIESRPGDERTLEALGRDGLSDVVTPLAAQAIASGERLSLKDLEVNSPFGSQKTDILAHPMKDETAAIIFLVSDRLKPVVDQFAARPISRDQRISDLQDELKGIKLELKIKVEEIETANEELKSSNEEMMSMNEELQSANEELTTANEELKNKIDELTLANADLDNFLQSSDLAMIVLDRESRIRHITKAARNTFPLVPTDEGRSLAEFNIPVAGVDLHDEVRKVIKTGESSECTTSPNDEGKSFFLRVTPYFFASGAVEGASVTLLDISEEVGLRQDLKFQSEKLRTALETARMGMAEHDAKILEISVDATMAAQLNLAGPGVFSRENAFQHIAEHDRAIVFEALEGAAKSGEGLEIDFAVEVPGKEPRQFRSIGFPFTNPDGQTKIITPTVEVTAIKHQQMLVEEMSHRIKNLFAVIGGLIQAAPQELPETQKMAGDLIERVVSLGRVYDLARKDFGSGGADLDDLIHSVVQPHATSQKLILKGPKVHVDGDAVNTLTLIIHELTTNATKYGALAKPKGAIEISWKEKSDNKIELNWSEDTPDFELGEDTEGFGTVLIDTGVRQLKGDFSRDFSQKGAQIELHFQL